MPSFKLDAIDIKILNLLQENAKLTNVELAARVNLSPSPCLARVRALEQAGIVSRHVTLLDPLKIGLGLSVFIQVGMERQAERDLEKFQAAIISYAEVMECYLMTGDADYMLRVIVAVQKPLVGLLSRLPGVDRVHGFGEELPEFDLYCPMLSMPLALGTTLETIPSAASYLQADATQAASWGARLAGMDIQGLRVGLVWAGNPRLNAPRLAAVDLRRSLSPDRLAPLFGVPNVRFFSLQKDGPAAPGHFPLIDLMQDVGDFADTAALLANLDLVISVDTSVAHLAAALGKPVWVLDRFDPCWRWIAGRNDSPWYPTLRLYRQKQPGDWDGVLADVTKDLHRLAEPAPNRQTANSRMIA